MTDMVHRVILSHCFVTFFRKVDDLNGALINGLEARVTSIEEKFEDLDARTSEEADNALNDRELDRFIMSGMSLCFYALDIDSAHGVIIYYVFNR